MKTLYEIRNYRTGELYKAPYGCRFVYNKMKSENKIFMLKLLADILKVFPEEYKTLVLFEVIYNEKGEEVKKWLVWDGFHNIPEDIKEIIRFSQEAE